MSFYWEKQIKSGKSVKFCGYCSKTIPVGTPHYTVTNVESYGVIPLCVDCRNEVGKKVNWDQDKLFGLIYGDEEEGE